MKKYWICCLLLTGFLRLQAQDLIIKMDDTSLEARVLRVEEKVVVYQLPDEGTQEYSLPREDLAMIAYESGMKQYFEVVAVNGVGAVIPLSSISNANVMYLQGKKDARKEYNDNGPLLGTMLPTAVFPPIGLVTGVVISAFPPQVSKNGLGDPALFKNPNYVAGYNRKLRSRKITGTSLGFLGGILLFVAWVSIAST